MRNGWINVAYIWAVPVPWVQANSDEEVMAWPCMSPSVQYTSSCRLVLQSILPLCTGPHNHFPLLQSSSLHLDTRITFSSCLPHHLDQSVLAASWQLMLQERIRALQDPNLFPPSPAFFSLLLPGSRGERKGVQISCNRPFKCLNHQASLTQISRP